MAKQKSPGIPQIDLRAWMTDSELTTRKDSHSDAWDSAFRHHGLVYLTNHGLATLYHRVAEEWSYFCEMPDKEKEKFSSSSYGACGYNTIGKEAVALSELGDDQLSKNSVMADPVESLENGYSDAFDGAFPRHSNGYMRGDKLRDACLELYQALHKKVILPCLAIASVALGMDQDSLEKRWFASGPGAYQLRLARYTPRNHHNGDKEHNGDREILYGEHTDYDGLTFLWRNQTNGLEAFIDGAWHEVPVVENHPDALVINLGDLMQFWTSGYWHSPPHRVLRTKAVRKERSNDGQKETPHVCHKDTANDGKRSASSLVSIVFFAGPHEETKLLPLPSAKFKSQQQVGQVITAGEHVRNKIAKTAQQW